MLYIYIRNNKIVFQLSPKVLIDLIKSVIYPATTDNVLVISHRGGTKVGHCPSYLKCVHLCLLFVVVTLNINFFFF